jgi:hypothetical protein
MPRRKRGKPSEAQPRMDCPWGVCTRPRAPTPEEVHGLNGSSATLATCDDDTGAVDA